MKKIFLLCLLISSIARSQIQTKRGEFSSSNTYEVYPVDIKEEYPDITRPDGYSYQAYRDLPCTGGGCIVESGIVKTDFSGNIIFSRRYSFPGRNLRLSTIVVGKERTNIPFSNYIYALFNLQVGNTNVNEPIIAKISKNDGSIIDIAYFNSINSWSDLLATDLRVSDENGADRINLLVLNNNNVVPFNSRILVYSTNAGLSNFTCSEIKSSNPDIIFFPSQLLSAWPAGITIAGAYEQRSLGRASCRALELQYNSPTVNAYSYRLNNANNIESISFGHYDAFTYLVVQNASSSVSYRGGEFFVLCHNYLTSNISFSRVYQNDDFCMNGALAFLKDGSILFNTGHNISLKHQTRVFGHLFPITGLPGRYNTFEFSKSNGALLSGYSYGLSGHDGSYPIIEDSKSYNFSGTQINYQAIARRRVLSGNRGYYYWIGDNSTCYINASVNELSLSVDFQTDATITATFLSDYTPATVVFQSVIADPIISDICIEQSKVSGEGFGTDQELGDVLSNGASEENRHKSNSESISSGKNVRTSYSENINYINYAYKHLSSIDYFYLSTSDGRLIFKRKNFQIADILAIQNDGQLIAGFYILTFKLKGGETKSFKVALD